MTVSPTASKELDGLICSPRMLAGGFEAHHITTKEMINPV